MNDNTTKKILYILPFFPKLSETFIFDEIFALKQKGYQIKILSLNKRLRESVIHNQILDSQLLENTTWFNYEVLYHSLELKSLDELETIWNNMTFFSNVKTTMSSFEIARLQEIIKSISNNLIESILLFYLYDQSLHLLHDIDHIHCHFAYDHLELAYLASIFNKKPYTFTVHADDIFVQNKKLERWINNSKKCITISKYNQQFLLNLGYISEKIMVNKLGVDVDFFRKNSLSSKKKDEINIVCISRLDEKKGIDILIHSLFSLKKLKIPFHCNIYGDGNQKALILSLIDNLDLKSYISLHSAINRTDVKRILNLTDIFVLPSKKLHNGIQDGIPVVLMEAMSMEVPCISTFVSGIPELINDHVDGFLISSNDSQSLTLTIQKILMNEKFITDLSIRARNKIKTEFNLTKNVDSLIAIFFDGENS